MIEIVRNAFTRIPESVNVVSKGMAAVIIGIITMNLDEISKTASICVSVVTFVYILIKIIKLFGNKRHTDHDRD